jgi:hypothetical protein
LSEREHGEVARLLAFDTGCRRCTQIAAYVQQATRGWVTGVALDDPWVIEVLDRHQGPARSWVPALIEAEGDRVRVTTGISLQIRLVRELGLARASRVAGMVLGAPRPRARRRRMAVRPCTSCRERVRR